MKVTQEKFDDRRKELEDVQQDLKTKEIEFRNCRHNRNNLSIQVKSIQNWFELVDIEKDLSLNVRDMKLIRVRNFYNYRDKGYYLDAFYDWNLVIDNGGVEVLVPTKKP